MKDNNLKIQRFLTQCQKRVEAALKKKLPPQNKEPKKLHQAMAYSILNGGKRLRPAFIYATGKLLGADTKILDDLSASMEMIHAFILIHDDLPALDNDDLRRGKPTCHKAFDEPTAILAGDALLARAFEIVSQLDQKKVSAKTVLVMTQLLGQYMGSFGLIGGEFQDIEMVAKTPSLNELENMYLAKSGAPFIAAVLLGVLAANYKNKKNIAYLTKCMEFAGVAFQIHDDIIGIESDEKLLGKKQGADLEMNKPIYPVIAGMEKAKAREKFLMEKAFSYLDKTGLDTSLIKLLLSYLVERRY